ncbi:MAG TPA: TetR family transcriptional regulator [Acidimicrobiales bacterium]|jgi:AcrR family transcriptional regulator|nr:TetR family transcriptional regulator [Acidimicrobiales bacterium]
MPGDEAPSLRERNKARARAEIAAAALDLFAQRGFADVTVDEIVIAAGVSRRTFFRYFETKEDALLADYPELNVRLADSLSHGHAEDLMGAVRASLHRLADWYVERSEAVLARSQLIHDALAVAARNLEFFSQWEKAIAATTADSMGLDPGGLVPRTIAAAVVGAFRAALSQWVRSSCQEDLHALTDQALDVVSAGLHSHRT